MNGPIPEAEAKIIRSPKISNNVTIGSSHHSLRFQKKANSSPTTPKFDAMLRKKLLITPPHFLITKLSMYRVSISLFPNVFRALAGVLTIGSPRRLKLVLSRTGTPVASPNSSIAR